MREGGSGCPSGQAVTREECRRFSSNGEPMGTPRAREELRRSSSSNKGGNRGVKSGRCDYLLSA